MSVQKMKGYQYKLLFHPSGLFASKALKINSGIELLLLIAAVAFQRE